MPDVRSIAEKVRSKNAGPFWVTVDVFCGSADAYRRIRSGLDSAEVARRFNTPLQLVKRFDIDDLNVVKFSVPRPKIQGMADDRDMHGAAWAALIAEIDIP